jgi:NDP-sugar pyrophosphorylase family protein
MAGEGRRFAEKGFDLPKPLIMVGNKSIIEHALDSLDIDGNYIFITRSYEKELDFHLESILKKFDKHCKIIKIDYLTDGPAKTAFLAKTYLQNDENLIITNCDQYTEWQSKEFLEFVKMANLDGCVTTYPYRGIKIGEKSPYSFIKVDENDRAICLDEKTAISNIALNGIHYWKRGQDFLNSGNDMFQANDRVNNEFYISKSFNYMIKRGLHVGYFPMKFGTFYSLGTPDDVTSFLKEKCGA